MITMTIQVNGHDPHSVTIPHDCGMHRDMCDMARQVAKGECAGTIRDPVDENFLRVLERVARDMGCEAGAVEAAHRDPRGPLA